MVVSPFQGEFRYNSLRVGSFKIDRCVKVKDSRLAIQSSARWRRSSLASVVEAAARRGVLMALLDMESATLDPRKLLLSRPIGTAGDAFAGF
jgi:hypothetical protein